MDKVKMDMLLKRLLDSATSVSRLESGEIQMTYFEIPLEAISDEDF